MNVQPFNRINCLTSFITNLKSTTLTAFYGLLGLASTVGIPYFGFLPIPYAIAISLVPIVSRLDQMNDTVEHLHKTGFLDSHSGPIVRLGDRHIHDQQQQQQQQQQQIAIQFDKSHYSTLILFKVVINCFMPVVCSLSAVEIGQNFAYALLGGWLVAKLICGGSRSPIEFMENLGRVIQNDANVNIPRNSFSASLLSNIKDTLLVGWYGIIGLAATSGAPVVGSITWTVALMMFLSPIISRVDQILEIYKDHATVFQPSIYIFRSLFKVFTNVFLGTIIAALAIQSNSSIIPGGVLIGWIVSKVLSSGDFSPLYYMTESNPINPPQYEYQHE
jgi:hypothetical protein